MRSGLRWELPVGQYVQENFDIDKLNDQLLRTYMRLN